GPAPRPERSLGCDGARAPIQPNYGKPVVSVEFESSTWLAEVMIWVTGEAELATVGLFDERIVNKHIELVCNGDLEVLLACDAAWSGVGRREARLRQRCRATTPGFRCIAGVSKIAYATATALRL